MNSSLTRTIIAAACIFAGSLYAAAPDGTGSTPAPGTRIGTYDSRSIAVAYAGSAAQRAVMDPLKAAFQKAKQEGNQAEMEKLQAQGRALQEQAHRQGFGTAPVDDLLEKIADALPEVRRNAGVSALVSLWDENTLAQYAGAVKVDVTMQLVDAFKPTEKQRKVAEDIRKQAPVAMDKLKGAGK